MVRKILPSFILFCTAVIVAACGTYTADQPSAPSEPNFNQEECGVTASIAVMYAPPPMPADPETYTQVTQFTEKFLHERGPNGKWGYFQEAGDKLDIREWGRQQTVPLVERMRFAGITVVGKWFPLEAFEYNSLKGTCDAIQAVYTLYVVEGWSYQPNFLEYRDGSIQAQVLYSTYDAIIQGTIDIVDLPAVPTVGISASELSQYRPQAVASYGENTAGVDAAMKYIRLAAYGRNVVLYTALEHGIFQGVLVESAVGQ